MKKLLLCFVLLFAVSAVNAKGSVGDELSYLITEDQVLEVVEQMPTYPGGQKALLQYISDNIKYPSVAQENGIQGRVLVRFVVKKDGSVGEVQVLRGVHETLDKEAVRLMKSLPCKFTPGKQNGRPVNVWFTMPISFKLM